MSLENLIISDKSLGKGRFATVFMGQLSEKKVATKKLSQSKEEFDNLVSEASSLKRLRHGKHITYIYGITLKNENLYMVMEYCGLGDLQNYLERNAGLVTYEQKILFCRGILLGLFYCHSMKIFHGDIKCPNVILGKNLEPKLIDFGLSMMVDNIEYYSKVYGGGMPWAAPELFSMEREGNLEKFRTNPYPTDVYSLGATFCQISFDGATQFIDSKEPNMDFMLGLVSPTPKDGFLREIIDRCCRFERNERITLDECLSMLNIVAEEQLLVPTIDDKWQRIQQDIQENSNLELPPSFILHRPVENLVVGPSNLSLLEWLCINNCVDAVKYMIQLHEHDQNQIKWLYAISELCKSPEVVGFLQTIMRNSERSYLVLSNLIDSNPQQFVEVLIKAGASCHSHSLLKKAIERHRNMTVQAIIDSKSHFKNWAIYDAIKFGNTEAIKILSDAGADLEREDRHTGNTPLKIAIETENIEMVKFLLELSVDANSKSNCTQSGVEAEVLHRPLCLAALKGSREIVKLLIDAGATIDITSSEWHSLSQSLEQQGNISMARFIRNNISKGPSSVKENPLYAAIRDKQPNLMQTLINNRENIDEIGLDGYAPLHWVVDVDDEETVKSLIRAGADLDIRTSNKAQTLHSAPDCFNECTPLHIAVSKKRLGIARLLIESGTDFSAKNGLQQTIVDIAKEDEKEIEKIIRECAPISTISIQRAMKSISPESVKILISNQQVNAEILCECLCIAASSGKNDLIEYLLKCGANVNNEYQGKNPLGWAIFGANIQAMKILINADANINAENSRKETPLFQCVRESQVDMVQFLVDKGADVNAGDKDGNTPIHYANDMEIMKILINAGADINVENQFGRTLLIQYVSRSNIEIVEFLVDKGADVQATNEYGNTPIHFVRDKEMAEILIYAGADINVKDKHGETLFDILIEEQNRNLNNNQYEKEKVCKLTEYLRVLRLFLRFKI